MCLPLSPSLAVSCHRLAITRRGPRSPLEEGVVPPISGLNDVWGGWEVKKINHFTITCKQLPKISESTHTHTFFRLEQMPRVLFHLQLLQNRTDKNPPRGHEYRRSPLFLEDSKRHPKPIQSRIWCCDSIARDLPRMGPHVRFAATGPFIQV